MCFFKNFVQLIFTCKSLPFFLSVFFCVVDIVISREGECSEGLGTSFISDMRKKEPDRARGVFSVMFLFSRTKFTVMSVY